MKTMKALTSLIATVIGACVLAACSPTRDASVSSQAELATPAETDYFASLEQWRSERDTRLRNPDGWLSFAGSGQVSRGAQSVGSDSGNTIVLSGGPALWGTLHLDSDGTLRFEVAAGADVTVDGQSFESVRLLHQEDEGGPTYVHAGALRFYVVKTGDVYGWRFRDPQSSGLKAFKGVPNFPIDPSWRIDAQWQPFEPPREIEVVTSNGTLDSVRVPGRAVFERDGRQFALLPAHDEDDEELFFILADRTSGKETYGGGRFLYTALPKDGKVELDFNKALNPPCALNGHVVCPLAPPENRLDLRIEAGEKTYPLTK
jgi:hypothetical protein